MKKRIISKNIADKDDPSSNWLDLESICVAEISSEDDNYPIEGALLPDSQRGWKAGNPGAQTISLLFNQPQYIHRIQLSFSENEVKRSQEYVLQWSQDNGQTFREIVRQQWNFSPEGSTEELADYTLALMDVTILELKLIPDINSQSAIASLEKMRIA